VSARTTLAKGQQQVYGTQVTRFDDQPVLSARLKCSGCGSWVPYEPPDDDAAVAVSCPECGLETRVSSSS
jgi:hypothetical protein